MKKDLKDSKLPAISEEVLGQAGIMVANRQVDISTFSPAIQEALKKYDLTELIGIAPSWTPKPGDAIVGTITQAKFGVGRFALDSKGEKNMVLIMDTPMGPMSVWCSSDLKMKFNANEDPNRIEGRSFAIQFVRRIPQSELKTAGADMKEYKVFEVKPKARSVNA